MLIHVLMAMLITADISVLHPTTRFADFGGYDSILKVCLIVIDNDTIPFVSVLIRMCAKFLSSFGTQRYLIIWACLHPRGSYCTGHLVVVKLYLLMQLLGYVCVCVDIVV